MSDRTANWVMGVIVVFTAIVMVIRFVEGCQRVYG